MCLFGVTNEGNEEEVGYIFIGCFGLGLGVSTQTGYGPKAHSQPSDPLATARLRVMVSGRGFGSHIYIYNTYIRHISSKNHVFIY